VKSAGEVAVKSAETTFTLAEATVEPVRFTVTVRVVPFSATPYVRPEKYTKPAEADSPKNKQAENISQYGLRTKAFPFFNLNKQFRNGNLWNYSKHPNNTPNRHFHKII
jgi:hypothetical protein